MPTPLLPRGKRWIVEKTGSKIEGRATGDVATSGPEGGKCWSLVFFFFFFCPAALSFPFTVPVCQSQKVCSTRKARRPAVPPCTGIANSPTASILATETLSWDCDCMHRIRRARWVSHCQVGKTFPPLKDNPGTENQRVFFLPFCFSCSCTRGRLRSLCPKISHYHYAVGSDNSDVVQERGRMHTVSAGFYFQNPPSSLSSAVAFDCRFLKSRRDRQRSTFTCFTLHVN